MLAIFGLGHWEITAVLVVAVLLFGTRLPKIARALGASTSEFRRGKEEIERELREVEDETRKTLLP